MAIRITRVYTRTGDTGETALVGGRRVPKDSPRIEAYGTIDELNSIIGLARVFNAEQLDRDASHRRLDEILRRVQNELFDLGSELATPPDAAYEGMFRMSAAEVTAPRAPDGRVPEGIAAAEILHPAGRGTGRRASCTRLGRSAGAPSARSWACPASSRSASGRSSTSIA